MSSRPSRPLPLVADARLQHEHIEQLLALLERALLVLDEEARHRHLEHRRRRFQVDQHVVEVDEDDLRCGAGVGGFGAPASRMGPRGRPGEARGASVGRGTFLLSSISTSFTSSTRPITASSDFLMSIRLGAPSGRSSPQACGRFAGTWAAGRRRAGEAWPWRCPRRGAEPRGARTARPGCRRPRRGSPDATSQVLELFGRVLLRGHLGSGRAR